MDAQLKLAILQSGRKQWEIAREVGIHETRLSKYIQGYGHLTDDERRRLWEVLGLGADREGDTDAA
jgi:plasmid maintenance system antidote protein VapI